MTVKLFETIEFNFMTGSADELKAAERKKARLENAGYKLVCTGIVRNGTAMYYELEV